MSFGARLTIGIFSLLCAVSFFWSAIDPSRFPANSLVFHGMAVFLVIIAIACFFPRSHPFTLRIIGGAIFLSYSFYVFKSYGTEDFALALRGFAVWGLPSGYLMLVGNYPIWGKGGTVLSNSAKKRK